jgi:DNA-binding NtrC family response regulator
MGEIRVLIIDDEEVIREGVQRALSGRGYTIEKAPNGEKGIEMIRIHGFDIVLLDLMMPGIDGFAVLDWIKEHRPKIEVIVITGFATVSKAVTAMKQGAFDFVGKPFTPDYIRIVVSRAAEKILLEAETVKLREEHSLSLAAIQNEQSRLKTVFGCMVATASWFTTTRPPLKFWRSRLIR